MMRVEKRTEQQPQKSSWFSRKTSNDIGLFSFKTNRERNVEIMGICELQSNIIVAYLSGHVVMISKENKLLSEIDLGIYICCATLMETSVIVRSGNVLLDLQVDGNELVGKFFASIDQYTSYIVFLGHEQFLTCTLKGELYCWSLKKRRLEKCWNVQSTVFCVNVTHLHNEPKIWIGVDSEVLIYNLKGDFERRLKMERKGEVVCIQHIGIDSVWVSLREKQSNKGILLQWEFI